MNPKKSYSFSEEEDNKDDNLNKDDEDYDFSPIKEDCLNLCYSKSTKIKDFSEHKIYSLYKRKHSSYSSYEDIESDSNNKSIINSNKKELTSFQKSYIKSQKENFDKQFNLFKTDFNLLVEYEKKIFKDTNLDIMFIMDLTGSMSMWLNEAKKSINDIIEEITDNNPGSKIRLSFIGYRDFTSAKEIRVYNSIEFTDNLKNFNKFLSDLDCYGGGDEPEDVAGALSKALEMKWESTAKYAVLVCDAPCHGKKYHNVLYDKFEKGDPDGFILEEIVQKFYDKGITFYCVEINNSTKKMFDIMKRIYNDENKFHIEKLGNSVHQFSFFVAFSASLLLENTKYNKIKFQNFLDNYRKETIKKIISKYSQKKNIENRDYNINSDTFSLISQIENLDLEGNDRQLFDFINRMNDLKINSSEINAKEKEDKDDEYITIKLDETIIRPMNENIVNYTLRGITYNKDLNLINDWINPTIIEQNLDTKLLFSYNTLKYNNQNTEYEIAMYDFSLVKNLIGIIPYKIRKKEYNDIKLFINKICMNTAICEQIGDYFNIRMHDELPQMNKYIKFQKHIIYEYNNNIQEKEKSEEENGRKKEYHSKLIIADYTLLFDNNSSVPLDSQMLKAFSHFSYQISGGQLLITDLKYDKIKRIVTDFKIYFLEQNGYKNILEFFSSHICDNNCKLLGLSHPRKKNKNIIVDELFFANKYYTNTILCKCCYIPIAKNEQMCCEVCSIKLEKNKKKAICSVCHFPFIYSTYLYNCKLVNIPTKCQKCLSNF